MTTSAIIEARILDLTPEDMTETTIRDILTDMLELEPAAYADAATDLCLRLLDGASDTTEDRPRTMNDFLEAAK